ncbi:MAG: acyl carrier protein [Bryobacterales bacterium]|nr:acyl carrier protein [Bryobacterales bacterium]
MQNELRSLIVEITGLKPDFDGSANLYTDLGVPSVKAMQLLMDLEEKFEVSVPDDDFIEATSLDTLVELIGRLRSSS